MLLSQAKDILCAATKNRLSINLRYDDDTLDRLFDPYHFYLLQSTANYLLSGYQTSNPNKLEPSGFHTFNLQLFKDITLTDKTFNPNPRFIALLKKYDQLICSISLPQIF